MDEAQGSTRPAAVAVPPDDRDRARAAMLDFSPARRPAVAAAVVFMVGVGVHAAVSHQPVAWLIGGVLFSGLAAWAIRRPVLSSCSIAVALFCSAVAAAQVATFQYPGDHISALAADTPRLAQLEMRLIDPPRLVIQPTARGGPRRALPPKQVTRAEVTAVLTRAGWAPATGTTLVQLTTPHPRLAVGQTVRVLGMLQRPGPAMNPGQFDWASYYREQRVLTSVQIPEPGNVTIVAPPPRFMPRAWVQAHARRLLAAGFPAERSLDHALLRALLLGDNDPELRDVQDDFKRTGTSHHLAISGMHIAILGGFVYLVCRAMRLTPRVSTWAMVAFVVLYGVAALPSPPVVRSVLLCAAFGVGRVFRRTVDAIQLLAVTVLAMLIYHPPDLFNAGFQLSFGTVLGLMILTGPAVDLMRSAGTYDPLPPAGMGRVPLDVRAAHWADRNVLTIVAAALVAWFVSLPLIALHFEQLNPWAVFAGLLLAPMVFFSLIGGLLKVVLTLIWPGGAPVWAAVAAAPIGWTRRTVEWLATFPGSDVPLPAPPVWLLFAFYAALCFVLPRWRLPTVRWCARCGPVAACGAIFLLPVRDDVRRALPALQDEVRVTFLAVGAGQCAVLEPPSGRTTLIDAGSASLADLLFKCLGPYLRSAGHSEVDTVLVTHANYDHYSAVAELAEAYGVREVLTAPHFRAHARDNPSAETLLASLDRLNRPPRVVTPGERLPLGRDSEIEILWPPEAVDAATLNANDASLVFRLTHRGRAILFTGDIQDDALRELLKTPEKLRADVLVAPHHGSAEPSTPAFLRAVGARHVVSSNDRTLTGKQLRFDALVAETGAAMLRTNRCGAITVRLTADGEVDIKTFLNAGDADPVARAASP